MDNLSLTEAQVASYHDNGFLQLDALTTQDEVARIRGIYDRLFASGAARASGDQFDLGGTGDGDTPPVLPQILNPVQYAPELAETHCYANAFALARQLLGDAAQANGGHAIMKPAGIGAPTPWHQDEAYWDPGLAYNALSVWIPLQPATVENGCMHFIPGSHRQEIQPHHSINHDPRIHGLEVDVDAPGFHPEGAVACPLPAGGATIHDARTFHYAGANTTGESRRALILMFGVPVRPYPGERRFPWMENKANARGQWKGRAGE